jgi:hypothetical protein
MENREGRKLIERTGDYCERKNGNGVDPNRNWAVDWGRREKDYSGYEENAGLHAFSEPEAYILRNLVDDFKPHVWVNVHSGVLSDLKTLLLLVLVVLYVAVWSSAQVAFSSFFLLDGAH